MTHKEIADRLRSINTGHYADQRSIAELINELDPPKPEPGTVVWWRHIHANKKWYVGIIGYRELVGITIITDDGSSIKIDRDIEYKYARICAHDEVPVKIPPVSEWDYDAERITVRRTITRDEAKRMEAGDV